MKLATVRFDGWRESVNSICFYRVAKADSLGRNTEDLPREKWFTSEAQEWFI